jgi:hypothetical protein
VSQAAFLGSALSDHGRSWLTVDSASLDVRNVSWPFFGLSTLNIEKNMREVKNKRKTAFEAP